jgi:hypothetical protein
MGGDGLAQICMYVSEIDVVRLFISLIVCDHSSWVNFSSCFNVCVNFEMVYEFSARNLIIIF